MKTLPLKSDQQDSTSESKAHLGTTRSVLDYFMREIPKSAAARTLMKLLQLRPELGSRRCWISAKMAEAAGEVGVTEPLRVPLIGENMEDLEFMDTVIEDLERGSIDWSLAIEERPSTYFGISVWRKTTNDL